MTYPALFIEPSETSQSVLSHIKKQLLQTKDGTTLSNVKLLSIGTKASLTAIVKLVIIISAIPLITYLAQ